MERQILLANGVHLLDAGPEVPGETLIACRQQIDVIEHAVVTIILDVFEPRALGLDAHIDVFRDQTDKRARVIGTEAERHIDNAIVIGVVLVGVEERHFGIVSNQLIRKDGQGTKPVLIEIGSRNLDAFLDFLG